MAYPEITPESAARLQEGTFPGDLGIELVSIDDAEVRGRMPVDRRHLHGGGVVHGGAWTALADTIAAWGTMRLIAPGFDFTTVELKMNVFTSARDGDLLEATGTPLHLGRRTQVWEVRVRRGQRLAASFSCTQMLLELPPA